MARVVIVGDQIITEEFITQRIHQQLDYLANLQIRKPNIKTEDYSDYWESGWDRLNYFKNLKEKTKLI